MADQWNDRPPGWSYNPSSWADRVPLLVAAAAGLCIAGYLACYQIGMVSRVWEPWFGDGSRIVLHS